MWVVDQKKTAVVTERATAPRSYVVVTQDCNPIWRNRRHLVSLQQTVQQELVQKEETTPSSLPSQPGGSQLAKHQPMLSKQPNLDGWLGRQSDLTYKTFVLLLSM